MVEDKPKRKGRAATITLWTAVITTMGTTTIPQIVELLSSKPSTAQVQGMIASQTKKHTERLNKLIEVGKRLRKKVGDLEGRSSELEASLDLIARSLASCCSSGELRHKVMRLEKLTEKMPGAEVGPKFEKTRSDEEFDIELVPEMQLPSEK